MRREYSGSQPVAWPMDFDQPPHTESSSAGATMTEAERLRIRRAADEGALESLSGQKALYIQKTDIPHQLELDIDYYRMRLAITGADGTSLPPGVATENLKQLVKGKLLHNNGVARILIKDFKQAKKNSSQ